MNYTLYCITLPMKVIKLIKNIEQNVGEREALESLLVCAGGKPGDKIEWLKPEHKRNYFKETLKKISHELPNIQSINDKIGEVIYFNENQTTIKTAQEIAEIFEQNLEGNIKVGTFYGYPLECCIPTSLNGTGMKEFIPGTEHYWCSPTCKDSRSIQENNYKIIENNIPDFKKYLDNWGKLN